MYIRETNKVSMAKYYITNENEYQKDYQESVENPKEFWEEIAHQFKWKKPWTDVLEYDFEKANIKWFLEGKLNITENCIDRHLATHRNETAIIFEPNLPEEKTQYITYDHLYKEVCKLANVLKSKNIQKGDRVCLYLPMIPELAYAVLACARIGAIHSVVFAGFSSSALATRINDADCKLVITSDGSYRGEKVIHLKNIVDEALENCPSVEKVLVVKRTDIPIHFKENRDEMLQPLVDMASPDCSAETMDSEDPLFILYTSGSTGKPKGMVHTIGGYMVYTAFTFKNVFQYQNGDIYWCTADIGWITGHSYILYGPLANGATTLMFEGVPSFPDYGRFWQIVEKHKVNQFYTAPTAIRSLLKRGDDYVTPYNLSSLKVIGTVGEPINEEAWEWYYRMIGKEKTPVIDTWWQTETGGIMISTLPNITPMKPTFAATPLPGVTPQLMDDSSKIVEGNPAEGKLVMAYPWPSIARTIWGNHQRYIDTYFSAFPGKYFTGDGAIRDKNGLYRITGRVDDVIIVSGHNLGTAPIEDAIDEHEDTVEAAIVGFPHDVKGNALYGFVSLKAEVEDEERLKKEINDLISKRVSPMAKLDKIQFVKSLPKTRSGKIMRRILRKIAQKDTSNLGDISTLLNPEAVEEIKKDAL